jgi:hypothetical protein
VVVRRRPGGAPAVTRPGRLASWEEAHLPRRRYRRLLAAALLLVGAGWVLSTLVFVAVDPQTLHDLIESVANVPGDRVERPSDPLFYGLEATILGLSGVILVLGGVALGLGRERAGVTASTIGLVVALTAGAIVSLYVEQISAILSTLVNAGLLFAVVHYRNRFLGAAPGEPAAPGSSA